MKFRRHETEDVAVFRLSPPVRFQATRALEQRRTLNDCASRPDSISETVQAVGYVLKYLI